MNKEAVYFKVVEVFGSSWDLRKPGGCPNLAPVGVDGKGVYAGLPISVTQMPCLGVIPTAASHSPASNDYREDVDFNLEIYFYAFSFDKEEQMSKVLLLSGAIENIIANDRTLGGSVDVWRVTNIEYGGMVRQSAGGNEFVAAGGIVSVTISAQG